MRDTLYKGDLKAGTDRDSIAHRAMDLLPRGRWVVAFTLLSSRRLLLGDVKARVVWSS